MSSRRRGGGLSVALAGAFIVVPIAELWLIAQVAGLISWPVTIATLIAEAVVGAWLVKREGRSTWQRFRSAIASRNRVPAAEVVDGALVLVGGTLLLTPGFLTDIAAFLFIVPPTRALVNRFVRSRIRGRFGVGSVAGGVRRSPRPAPADPLDVEVVEVRRSSPPPPP